MKANNQDQLSEAEKLRDNLVKEKSQLLKLKDLPACTTDGRHFEMCANIGTPKNTHAALTNGAEGIGLYRTEFLFMDRNTMPSLDKFSMSAPSILRVKKIIRENSYESLRVLAEQCLEPQNANSVKALAEKFRNNIT